MHGWLGAVETLVLLVVLLASAWYSWPHVGAGLTDRAALSSAACGCVPRLRERLGARRRPLQRGHLLSGSGSSPTRRVPDGSSRGARSGCSRPGIRTRWRRSPSTRTSGSSGVEVLESDAGDERELAMSPESLTGLLSWLEAAPPGVRRFE